MAAELLSGLWEQIARRYAQRDGYALTDFLYANHLFRGVDDEFITFVHTHRDAILALLGDDAQRTALIDGMCEATRIYTWQRNQYLTLPPGTQALLASIYDALVTRSAAALRDAADHSALADAMYSLINTHHERLLRFFLAVCPSGSDGQPSEDFVRSVPCEEYSAGTQLQLLALTGEDLEEPVLDLGCGSDGRLLHFLHDAGITGVGVDRIAPHATGFLRADWEHAPLDPGTWGTVIAHQSFSLHFLFHHRHRTGGEERYARLFMRILDSLRPGGRFCYTPGLPFFEQVLQRDMRFQIQRFPHADADPALRDIACAVHVRR